MASGGTDNPIDQLTHDHGHLSDLVHVLGAIVARLAAGEVVFAEIAVEIEDGVESLREALLQHFAREEEAVFPFVEAHLPALRARVASLLADHDAVVGGVAELGRGLAAKDGAAKLAAGYEGFVAIYASHSRAEASFLRDVETTLDAALREQLRVLLAEI